MTQPPATPGRKLVSRSASEISWKIPKFFWTPTHSGETVGVLSVGSLAIAAGRPEAGKSSFGRMLCAQVTKGTLPGELEGTPANAMYIAGEENLEYNVVPGLLAAGADISKIEMPEVEFTEPDGTMETVGIVPEKDMSDLIALCHEKNIRFVVVDPLMEYMNGADIYKNDQVRAKLRPWVRMADEINGVVLAIAHLNKAPTGDVVAGINGSSAFGEVARCVLGFSKSNDDDFRIMSVEKNSTGKSGFAWTYQMVGVDITHPETKETANVGTYQLGDESDLTVGDYLRDQGESSAAKEDARDFLQELLKDGPVRSPEVYKEAEEAGISKDQAKRAKSKLGVRAKKDADGWWWALPEKNNGANAEASAA